MSPCDNVDGSTSSPTDGSSPVHQRSAVGVRASNQVSSITRQYEQNILRGNGAFPVDLPLPPDLDEVRGVVVVYHVTIEAIGHGLLKKFWPLVIGCVLRTAGSSII